MKKWITLFSQTGSEVVDLALHFNRWPDIIITNNKKENVHPLIRDRVTHYVTATEAKTLDILNKAATGIDLVTLHGWLRIVSEDICNKFNIYNGHPGLITEYPDLKGKDPQQRFFDNREGYTQYGSVVHKVVAEVDSGEVVAVCARDNNIEDIDQCFDNLRTTSSNAWIDFLRNNRIIKL